MEIFFAAAAIRDFPFTLFDYRRHYAKIEIDVAPRTLYAAKIFILLVILPSYTITNTPNADFHDLIWRASLPHTDLIYFVGDRWRHLSCLHYFPWELSHFWRRYMNDWSSRFRRHATFLLLVVYLPRESNFRRFSAASSHIHRGLYWFSLRILFSAFTPFIFLLRPSLFSTYAFFFHFQDAAATPIFIRQSLLLSVTYQYYAMPLSYAAFSFSLRE